MKIKPVTASFIPILFGRFISEICTASNIQVEEGRATKNSKKPLEASNEIDDKISTITRVENLFDKNLIGVEHFGNFINAHISLARYI